VRNTVGDSMRACSGTGCHTPPRSGRPSWNCGSSRAGGLRITGRRSRCRENGSGRSLPAGCSASFDGAR
jgi:hypothetical protein